MRIVVGHANPDFDAYASTVAATKLFPGAQRGLSRQPERERSSLPQPARGVLRLRRLARARHGGGRLGGDGRHARPGPGGGVQRRRDPSGCGGRRLRPPSAAGGRHSRRRGPGHAGGRNDLDPGARDTRARHRAERARGEPHASGRARGHRVADLPGSDRVRRGGCRVAHVGRCGHGGAQPVPLASADTRPAAASCATTGVARGLGDQRAADSGGDGGCRRVRRLGERAHALRGGGHGLPRRGCDRQHARAPAGRRSLPHGRGGRRSRHGEDGRWRPRPGGVGGIPGPRDRRGLEARPRGAAGRGQAAAQGRRRHERSGAHRSAPTRRWPRPAS